MQLYSHQYDINRERRTGMKINSENQNWEQVFKVIQKSFTVNKHVDFFKWMQGSVSEVLPHDVLVAAWGDFK